MVHFDAQPGGLGQFLSAAALVVVHLEPPNVSPPALPRIKTDTSAVVNETSTDPKQFAECFALVTFTKPVRVKYSG